MFLYRSILCLPQTHSRLNDLSRTQQSQKLEPGVGFFFKAPSSTLWTTSNLNGDLLVFKVFHGIKCNIFVTLGSGKFRFFTMFRHFIDQMSNQEINWQISRFWVSRVAKHSKNSMHACALFYHDVLHKGNGGDSRNWKKKLQTLDGDLWTPQKTKQKNPINLWKSDDITKSHFDMHQCVLQHFLFASRHIKQFSTLIFLYATCMFCKTISM